MGMVMSTAAAGAYLEVLRKHLNFSREKVAKQLKTSRSQIERIEGGIGETRTTQLVAFARFVQGKVDDVVALLDVGHTVEDGRRQAQELIDARAKQIADQVADADIPDALRFIRELRANPEMLNELRELLRADAESDDAPRH
jgi:transcriptional regulator with XRE-family HTH domain